MFSVIVIPDEDDLQVFLKYKGNGVEVQFNPEDPELILHSNLETDSRFLTSPGSGVSAIAMSSSHITFELSNYGSGDCGSLIVEVPNSVETTASFKECLSKWKDAANAMYRC